MAEMIRHYRVDTADRQRIDRWPSVSVLINNDFRNGAVWITVIGRRPPTPFVRREANQWLRDIDTQVTNMYQVKNEARRKILTDPKAVNRLDNDMLFTIIEQEMYDRFKFEHLGTIISFERWIHTLINEIRTTRVWHCKADCMERLNMGLEIDRETFEIKSMPDLIGEDW